MERKKCMNLKKIFQILKHVSLVCRKMGLILPMFSILSPADSRFPELGGEGNPHHRTEGSKTLKSLIFREK